MFGEKIYLLRKNRKISQEDFEERNYDKIERQIDKMLEDISNTYLKYENTLNKWKS